MSEYKYHSPFKRVCVTETGGQKIKKLQEEFDRFWKSVNRNADKCPEKFHAIKAMQEACMWLTRATALQNQKIEGIKGGEIIIDDPLCPKEPERTHAEIVRDNELAIFGRTRTNDLSTLKVGETITSNGIKIVVKKKKL